MQVSKTVTQFVEDLSNNYNYVMVSGCAQVGAFWRRNANIAVSCLRGMIPSRSFLTL